MVNLIIVSELFEIAMALYFLLFTYITHLNNVFFFKLQLVYSFLFILGPSFH